MGRNKKQIEYDQNTLDRLSKNQKIATFDIYAQIIQYELDKIPYIEKRISTKEKAESVAERYFEGIGYEVFRSRVTDGYRCIGVNYYWQKFADKITDRDKYFISRIHSILKADEIREFANIVRVKNGTPDLLLIKDDKISFVEVKADYETVKDSTVHFFVRYGEKWPLSIFRILTK